MRELLNKVVGRYRLEEYLGGDDDGHLFRGVQVGLNREVAVRVLTPEQAADSRTLTRFRQESRATAQLAHPHILTVYDSGKADGLRFSVTELLKLGHLGARLRAEGPLEILEALRIGGEVCQALHYIHERQIVHANIQPAHIRFDQRDATILSGFGVDAAERLARIEADGSHAYCPPELLLDEPVDSRTDLYQLGAVLYEAITGRRPYPGRPPFVAGGGDYEKEIESPRKIRAEVPAALDEVLLRCLRCRPGERPLDAKTLGRDLGKVERKLKLRAMSRETPSASHPAADQAPTRAIRKDALSGAAPAVTAALPAGRRPATSKIQQVISVVTQGQTDIRETETQFRLLLVLLPVLLVAGGGLYALSYFQAEDPAKFLEVLARPDATEVEVRWRTDRDGYGFVELEPYDGPGRGGQLSPAQGGPSDRFVVRVAGLRPATKYRYRVAHSESPAGTEAQFSAPGDVTTREALTLVEVDVISRGRDRAAIAWTTSQPGDSRVQYWRSGGARETVEAEDQRDVLRHEVQLTGLRPGTEYRFRVKTRATQDPTQEIESDPVSFRTREAAGGRAQDRGKVATIVARLKRMDGAQRAKLARSLGDLLGTKIPLNTEQKALLALTETRDAASFEVRLGLAQRWAKALSAAGVAMPAPPPWSAHNDYLGGLRQLEMQAKGTPGVAFGRLDDCFRALAATEGIELDE